MATPNDLLRAALTADPARPLLTFYDDATGERTELSVRTFENWVAKTANLLQDELAATAGSRLALALPVHWQAAVWMQAAWALGMEVVPGLSGDVVVTTPDRLEGLSGDVVSLSLRPALVAATTPAPPLPAGVLDGDTEVLAHGDRFVPYAPPAADAAALTVGGRTWSLAELGALAARGSGARVLVSEALDTVDTVSSALLVPLASGGSTVLVRNADPALLERRRETERVTG
ncbi:TIGR03089 family protein [Motilibacter peucedani]|uniref:TIGR03089 family protein n=1 Tax=Motilibacter peucedani TaxID=598650 RepID=UPI001E47A1A6|nr:TIGR03089 family protein [Motilibacter peucedani]